MPHCRLFCHFVWAMRGREGKVMRTLWRGLGAIMLIVFLHSEALAQAASAAKANNGEKKREEEAGRRMAGEASPKSITGTDGKEMVEVPGGEFWMGCNPKVDTECDDDEKPGRRVIVDTFRIDRTEVTVAEYGRCVDASACSSDDLTPPRDTTIAIRGVNHSDWLQACNWGKAGRENRPINCLTRQQAQAYCRWAGERLPTEAEWEKAARGTDGHKYPWGNRNFEAAGQVANIADETLKRNNPDMQTAEEYDDGIPETAPVGSFPAGASPYGALDMIGNVAEWTADWYDAEHQYRSLRGGSWTAHPRDARASARGRYTPVYRSMNVGFRCAQ